MVFSFWKKLRKEHPSFTDKGLGINMLGGFILGISTTSGIFLLILSLILYGLNSRIISFSIYLIISSIFYLLEFIWHAYYHPNTLDFHAFILYTHSNMFHFALFFSLLEYLIECYLFPNIKYLNILSIFGLIITIIGQVIRSLAMYTAGKNFTHLISTDKKKEHKLIKYGIYKYIRHPSYCGWFIWSIGTQLLISNPLSVIGFTIASWSFFNERIPFEETYLVKFFGNEYILYSKNTWIGVPFVKGYIETQLHN